MMEKTTRDPKVAFYPGIKYLRKMRLVTGPLAAVLILAAATGRAENYTAVIYANPTGTLFSVKGAGDNVMMTGSVVDTPTMTQRAFYMTATGHKDMHPAGWYESYIMDSIGSTYHYGHGRPDSSSRHHALFWVGGGPAVDLHPAENPYSSIVNGGGGQIQVGVIADQNLTCEVCSVAMTSHAGYWTRTASSFKRLHSTTHTNTAAWSSDGVATVGWGTHRLDGSKNAMVWPTTSSNGLNIRPSGSTESAAYAVWGNEQGGYYASTATGGEWRACLWKGTAASALDLNPNGVFKSSRITSVRSGLQVGYGTTIGTQRTQALAWHGNAAAWINLHSRLPVAFQTWHSTATDIDNNGNIVGSITHVSGTQSRPVIWLRQP